MFEQARARGKYRIERQPGLLQGNGPEKGNIEIRTRSGNKAVGANIQRFDRVEGTELAPRILGEFELPVDPLRHDGLMISVVYDEHGTFRKVAASASLSLFQVDGGLRKPGVVLGILRIGEACGREGTLASRTARAQPAFGCEGRD